MVVIDSQEWSGYKGGTVLASQPEDELGAALPVNLVYRALGSWKWYSANGHSSTSSGAATLPPQLTTPESSDNILDPADLQFFTNIQKDIKQVEKASTDLHDYETQIVKQVKEASEKVTIGAKGPITRNEKKDVHDDLVVLKKNVMKLMQKIPPMPKDAHGKLRINDPAHRRKRKEQEIQDKLPHLSKGETLALSPEFKDFKALYDGLSSNQKLCLLCFSAFPEKEIIKKRFMFYWWTAEGFLAPVKNSETTGEELAKTAEELASEVFSELVAKGFIEPISEKRTLDCLINEYEMHPFVRAAVIELARRAKFFDFDVEGKLTGNVSSCRECLLGGEKLKGSKESVQNIHMLFNVDQDILDFEKPDLFLMMKNINILCLGRWQTSQRHHIEVEDTKFLEGLKNMKHLKFLSLQGISQIMDLPSSISGLTNLTILDIKACPNLEKIPSEIGLLKSLTHLDMSECYLLVNMPKEISTLMELEVLKGFVVGDSETDSCTLGHLADLPKLRKLGIFTGKNSFPSALELIELNQLKELRNLTIEWGRDPSKNSNPVHEGNNGESNNTGNEVDSRVACAKLNCFRKTTPVNSDADARPFLPTKLEKLDLECFPKTYAPDWLKADKLENLKRLYIRGGTLRDLGQFPFPENCKWKVEILRLKFLNGLEMDWRGLMELFPKLDYLEKVALSCYPEQSLAPFWTVTHNRTGTDIGYRFRDQNSDILPALPRCHLESALYHLLFLSDISAATFTNHLVRGKDPIFRNERSVLEVTRFSRPQPTSAAMVEAPRVEVKASFARLVFLCRVNFFQTSSMVVDTTIAPRITPYAISQVFAGLRM
ncbi:hypothetical protein Vadar_002965 [Vaccinium darrowii]|uniref:Uncharacterized protein n=1 Tax=Vaccinium darrowii TaxID=229202 RepID=A0ACB7YTK1_9ERIC|nr:hypothetical protein Vadar_002965 [Vaccinium darrowii]